MAKRKPNPGDGQPAWSSEEVADAVAECNALNWNGIVELSFSSANDRDLQSLAKETFASRIQHLSLYSTQVGDDGLKHLSGLKSLTTLWLNSTQVGDDGLKHLSGLTSLTTLLLDRTQISDDGLKDLSGLTSLTNLGLNSTQVGDDGLKHLSGLKSLTGLWLRSTLITDPCELLNQLLPPRGRLELLRVTGCKGIVERFGIDEALLDTSNPAELLDRLRRASLHGRTPLPLVKGVVLGNGRIGKTFLRWRLAGEDPHAAEPPIDTTHDWERITLKERFRCGDVERVESNLYDFGGQPELHSCHRLFLNSSRNWFLIVVKGDQSIEASHLRYWLRLVRFYASANAPIIVVQNHCENAAKIHADWRGMDRGRLQQLVSELGLTNVRWVGGYFDVDTHRYSAKVLEQIREQIADVIGGMTYVAEVKYPPGFLKVLDWTRDGGELPDARPFERYVSRSDFDTWCRAVGAKPGEASNEWDDWRIVLTHLAAIADVAHLADVREGAYPELGDDLYRPDWLKNPMYALVRHLPSDGSPDEPAHMTRHEALTVMRRRCNDLGNPLTAQDAARVLRLMEALRLVFPARDATGLAHKYLVVDQLKAKPAPAAFKPQTESTRAFPFISEAYLPRLIGELREHVINFATDAGRHWAVFQFGDGEDTPRVRVLARVDLNAATLHLVAEGGDESDRKSRIDEVYRRFAELPKRDGNEPGKGAMLAIEHLRHGTGDAELIDRPPLSRADLMPTDVVAKATGMDAGTVRKWATDGLKVGSKTIKLVGNKERGSESDWRFSWREIESFLAATEKVRRPKTEDERPSSEVQPNTARCSKCRVEFLALKLKNGVCPRCVRTEEDEVR